MSARLFYSLLPAILYLLRFCLGNRPGSIPIVLRVHRAESPGSMHAQSCLCYFRRGIPPLQLVYGMSMYRGFPTFPLVAIRTLVPIQPFWLNSRHLGHPRYLHLNPRHLSMIAMESHPRLSHIPHLPRRLFRRSFLRVTFFWFPPPFGMHLVELDRSLVEAA